MVSNCVLWRLVTQFRDAIHQTEHCRQVMQMGPCECDHELSGYNLTSLIMGLPGPGKRIETPV